MSPSPTRVASYTMISINLGLSQGTSQAIWAVLCCCLAGTICTWLVFHPARPAVQTPSTQGKLAGLVQVSQNRNAADTNIDIIAIPGLDATSPDTWTWRAPGNPKDKKNYINWLEDRNMLPSIVPSARIFTCDWPTSMLQQSIPTTLEQSAQFLLESIEQHLEQNKRARNSRPVLFIASCLGGIVLLKALEIDQN